MHVSPWEQAKDQTHQGPGLRGRVLSREEMDSSPQAQTQIHPYKP